MEEDIMQNYLVIEKTENGWTVSESKYEAIKGVPSFYRKQWSFETFGSLTRFLKKNFNHKTK